VWYDAFRAPLAAPPAAFPLVAWISGKSQVDALNASSTMARNDGGKSLRVAFPDLFKLTKSLEKASALEVPL